MSVIQDQIKALQRKQAKIDRLQEILTFVNSRSQDPDHAGLQEEVSIELDDLIRGRIKVIELGEIEGPEKPKLNLSDFSEDEVAVLKMLVQKAAQKSPAIQSNPEPKLSLDPNDKIRFVQANKQFLGKRVQFISEHGPVSGSVKGLDSPNVIVTTDTGYQIPVLPSNLEIIKG